MITRKTTRIIGIAMIVVGLSIFFISYTQGVNNQYSIAKLDVPLILDQKYVPPPTMKLSQAFWG